jgi:surface protein
MTFDMGGGTVRTVNATQTTLSNASTVTVSYTLDDSDIHLQNSALVLGSLTVTGGTNPTLTDTSGNAANLTLSSPVTLTDVTVNPQNFNDGTRRPFVTEWNPAAGPIRIPVANLGTYNFTAYWGDGTKTIVTNSSSLISGLGNCGHLSAYCFLKSAAYPTGSAFTVTILPTTNAGFPRIVFADNATDRAKITKIKQWGTIFWTSMNSAFYGCSNVEVTASDAPNLTTPTTMNLGFMFRDATKVGDPAITTQAARDAWNTWNTSKVTSITSMFQGASNFNQNIGNWNTSEVTTSGYTFSGASKFNQDISAKTVDGTVRWNTSKVRDMARMFASAAAFNQNIGSWNTSAVTNMNSMFQSATNFNQDISRKANSVSTYTPAAGFQNTPTSDDAWYTGCVGRPGMTPIGGTGTCPGTAPSPAVTVSTAMSGMFQNATVFTQDLDNWCVSGFTGTPGAFGYTATGKVPLFGATGVAGQCPLRAPCTGTPNADGTCP